VAQAVECQLCKAMSSNSSPTQKKKKKAISEVSLDEAFKYFQMKVCLYLYLGGQTLAFGFM
jgi:hypothetical protein